jgi:CHRD domain
VPGSGDPDGTGSARITLDQGQGTICWRIVVSNLTLPAVAAHIHSAVAGAGPIAVPLSPPDATGKSSGCATDVSHSLIKAIRQHPSQYYVNVHTTDFSAAAARGQLSK